MDNKKPILNTSAVRELLLSDTTYATVLHAILYSLIGDDLYEDDSVEIYAKIKDITGEYMPEDNENKLQAILTAILTDSFYKDILVFKTICNTLIEGDPGIADIDMEDPSLSEIMWSLYEVELNREAVPFSPSVSYFIDRVTKGEAEEINEDPAPYYEKILLESASELSEQLKKAGFENFKLPNPY